MVPQAAGAPSVENLFSNTYKNVTEQLKSSSPDFDKVFDFDLMLNDLIHARRNTPHAKIAEFEHLTTLILEKAYAYVYFYIDQAHHFYAHTPLDSLSSKDNVEKAALFDQVHTSLKKAIELSSHIERFLNQLGDAAKIHRDHHKRHQEIVTRKVNDLARTINDYLSTSLKMLPEVPEFSSLFLWLLHEWRYLGNQFVSAKIIAQHPLSNKSSPEMAFQTSQLHNIAEL